MITQRTFDLIPALDILAGRAVRLRKGDFGEITDYGDPLRLAESWWRLGARRLHLVDLGGAQLGRPGLQTLVRVLASAGWKVQTGGGLRTEDHLNAMFRAGAERLILGTTAFEDPERFFGWLRKFGGDRIVLGMDVRDGRPAVRAWSDSVPINPEEFLKRAFKYGLRTVLGTAISRDGMMSGPDIELYRGWKSLLPELRIIASGGLREAADVEALSEAGIEQAVCGRALLEGNFEQEELKKLWSIEG